MVGIGTAARAARRRVRVHLVAPRRLPRLALVLPGGDRGRAAGLVALISGWMTTEVGRQPWIVYEVMRTSRTRSPTPTGCSRLRGARPRLPRWRAPSCGCCGGSRAPARERAGARLMCRDLPGPDRARGDRLRRARRRRLRRRLLGPDGRRRRARRPVRGLVQRSMSPVWEANHVWLIFVLVITWTAFPVAFGSIFVDALRAALPRRARGSSSAAPRSPCAGRRRRSARRACSARVFALSSVLARSSSAPRSAASCGAGRSATPSASGRLVAQPDLDRARRPRRAHRGLPRGGLPRRRRRRAGARAGRARSAPARWAPAS